MLFLGVFVLRLTPPPLASPALFCMLEGPGWSSISTCQVASGWVWLVVDTLRRLAGGRKENPRHFPLSLCLTQHVHPYLWLYLTPASTQHAHLAFPQGSQASAFPKPHPFVPLESQLCLLNRCHYCLNYLKWLSFPVSILTDSLHFLCLHLTVGKITQYAYLSHNLFCYCNHHGEWNVYCCLQGTAFSGADGMRDETKSR